MEIFLEGGCFLLPKMMLLINPHAGKGGYKSSLAEVLSVFCTAGWEPTVFFTKAAGDAPRLVRDNVGNYDMVVCVGGDGTLSETVSGMMTAPEKRPIGYIPLGTANDVARTLELPTRPVEAARQIVSGRRYRFDVGQFGTDSFFTYVAAFGAFTEVSYGTPQETKQALGHLAYMLEGIRSLSKITPRRAIVEYDGGVIDGNFVFGAVTNSTSIAGLVKLDRDSVHLSDGMFEVLLVRMPRTLADLNDILTAVLSNNFDVPNVYFLRSREVRMMFTEPVAWTRDGEDGGSHKDVYIVNRHPGVDLIV